MHALALVTAVVVGHNGSPAPDVPPLRYADDDAAQYARLLRERGARVTLLSDPDADTRALFPDARPDGPPTRAALLAAIERAAGADELYLVYAGHGDVHEGEGFVQLAGGRLTRADLYHRVLPRARARRVHVIVDACKSWFLVFGRGPGGAREPAGQFVDARGPLRFPRAGFVLSTSAAHDSHEWEALGAGVFSHEVRSALRGGADADGDGAVSYGELGAFVRRANGAIPNPRYRPRFTVVAPREDAAGLRAPIWSWPAASAARTLAVRGPAPRFSIEDALGVRLLDAHPGDAALSLRVPQGPLYLRAEGPDGFEVRLPERGDARLSDLARAPVTVAARGALHDAFTHLFARPFDAAAVEAYLRSPEPPPGWDAGPSPARARWRRIAGFTAAAALAAGAAASGTALALRGAAGESHRDASIANDRVRALNLAAIPLYGLSAAAGATWLGLTLWPDAPPSTRE